MHDLLKNDHLQLHLLEKYDSNKAVQQERLMQTIDKLNTLLFNPGDSILFKSGEEFKGMFWVKGSGNQQNPIFLGSYGGSTKPILNGDADLVIGSRFLNTSEKEVPGYRKIGINIITKVTNSGLKEKITDSQSGFRAYSKKLISNLDTSNLGMGISTEILIKTSSLGFKIAEVPITIIYEGKTSTHNPISHGTSVLFSTIKYTSIEHPLKFYGIPSVIFFIIGISFTYLSAQYYAEIGRLNTNLTIVAAGTILIAVVLLISSILLYTLVSVVRENNKK